MWGGGVFTQRCKNGCFAGVLVEFWEFWNGGDGGTEQKRT